LDFFTAGDPDMIFLHEFAQILKKELGAEEMRFEKRYDRSQFFFSSNAEEWKIEFVRYDFQHLEVPMNRDGIFIDSLRDIAASKLMAMLDRFDPKDFADLFFIFQERKLEEVWRDTEKKFGIKISPLFLGGEFSKARRIEALPKMIKPITIEELKSFFEHLAKQFAKDIF
jgi:predicted nucleotidyltransferase component of viral defense system